LKRKKRKKRFAFIESIWDKNKKLKFDPIDFYHPGMQAENKEDGALIFKCIQELPEMQRVVFLLYKLENLSYEEIAKVIDKSESAVNSLMHRAKENLKASLMKQIN
jgi:RNA polymerase sigma-70 factor (ECF subfamily)